jgi:endonuclease YncB( thermonuclease family)
MDWKSLYLQAVIADTETFGLDRGVGMQEASLYKVATKEINQYLIAPNLTIVQPANNNQDFVKFSSRASDKHTVHPGLRDLGSNANWADAVKAQLLMEKGKESQTLLGLTIAEIRGMSDDNLREEMKKRLPKVMKWVQEGRYPWLADLANRLSNDPGKTVTDNWNERTALAEAKKIGAEVDVFNIHRVQIEDLFTNNSNFARKLGEGAIWIANSNFESKQLGSKLAAMEEAVREQARVGIITKAEAAKKLNEMSPLRQVITETPLDVSDLFSVTGREVNLARYRGYSTGDWRGVYKAILENTKAGDVRDIIDVVRAQQSYLQKMNFLSGKAPSQLSMDIQARLYGFSIAKNADEAFNFLTKPELHAAWADSSFTENLVLRESLRQTDALDQVERRTAEGLRLIEEAKQGKGAFYSAIRYAAAKQSLDQLQGGSARQNIARAALDLLNEGATYQSGGHELSSNKRLLRSGLIENVPYARPIRGKKLTNLDRVVETISSRPDYSEIDVQQVYKEMQDDFINKGFIDAKDKSVIQENLESYRTHLKSLVEGGNEYIEDHFKKVEASMGAKKAEYIRSIEENVPAQFRKAENYVSQVQDLKVLKGNSGKILKGAGMLAAGIAAVGLTMGEKHSLKKDREGLDTVRTMNYEKWLSLQQEFSGLEQATGADSGFQEQGVGAAQRHQMTDFGSPYQGPVASSLIFQHQDLLNEREKYNRRAFGATHYDPQSSIGSYMAAFGFNRNVGILSSLNGFKSHYTKYTIPSDGHYVETQGYEGLSKGSLLNINLSNYKLSAEDADTITLQKKGVINSLSYFFGFSSPMSVRFSGIDAPETAHGNRGAMPLAENSKVALQAMLNGGGNLELLIDPSNVTYGRTVGFLFKDETNVNLELVRQGKAAYLPFRGGGKNYYNPAIFSRTEKLAQGSEKQMWGQGYYKAYRDVVASSGSTITFNTLVNPEKVAKNASLMSAVSLMRTADDMGLYTLDMAMEAADIGRRLKGSNFQDDYKRPILFNHTSKEGGAELEQLKFETGKLMQMREGSTSNKLSRKMGYGDLDKSLVLDSMGSTGSIFNKRRLSTYETYDVDKERRKQEAAMLQRNQLKQMFNSPIGHYRM